MKLKIAVILFALILWPISLYLSNSQSDFIRYVIPTLLLITSYLLWKRNSKLYIIPTLTIPFFEPKLAVFPLTFFATLTVSQLLLNKKTAPTWFSLIAIGFSLIALAVFWKPFWGQTIFHRDYEAEQLVIRNTQLYPNVILARIFQNKPRIYLNKITANFFSLTDPNNYFFGSHPREIYGNQNLNKYPFLALPFLLLGIYNFGKLKNKKFILVILTSSIISLSILTSYDRHDVILWLPISLVLTHGVNVFQIKNRRVFAVFSFFFLAFTLVQLIRILIWKTV
jgi:hypothetical protein